MVFTRRDPVAVASKAKTTRITGIPSSGAPSSLAKASSTVKPRGASMERNSHDPHDSSPFGLVMT